MLIFGSTEGQSWNIFACVVHVQVVVKQENRDKFVVLDMYRI